jgi:hypothetical protein
VTQGIAVKHATSALTHTAPLRDKQSDQLWAAKGTANLRTKAAQIGGSARASQEQGNHRK